MVQRILEPRKTAVIVIAAAAVVSCSSPVKNSDDLVGGPVSGLTLEQVEKFKQCGDTFKHEFTVSEGLGPLYNGASCYSCHGAPGPAGAAGASPEDTGLVWIAERLKDRPAAAEMLDKVKGRLVLKDVRGLSNLGGPLLFRRSITDGEVAGLSADCKLESQRSVPAAELVSRRAAPPLFGIGLVNAMMDDDIDDSEDDQTDENVLAAGRSVDIRDPLTGKLRVGRLGLKAQQPNLVNMTAFMMNAGPSLSTPLYPEHLDPESIPRCMIPVLPPEPNDMGKTAARLIYFLSLLAPPERQIPPGGVTEGEKLFTRLECAFCHTPEQKTAPRVRVIDPDSPAPKFKYTQIDALSSKSFYPYSDFLLHYMGTELADGVPEGKATGGEWRTAPLWGLRLRKHFLHDGRAKSVEEAIAAHGGQAEESRNHFNDLSTGEKTELLKFLNSL